MRIGFYSAALGSLQQAKRLEVIANNLANVGTAGFKRDSVHFRDYMMENTYPRLEQGRIAQTGNPADIALRGDGYLSVRTDEGILYTRAGNLKLDADKTLVTQEGWPVMGRQGPIRLEKAELRIEEDGQIYDGDEVVDVLDIVQFPPNVRLVKARNGYLKPARTAEAPVPAKDCTVHQGALEEANFDVVQEMTQLIETTRFFESFQKTLRVHEDLDANVTSKLGNP